MEQLDVAWRLDEVTWLAGGVVFLLAVAVSLVPDTRKENRERQVMIWLLVAATLVTAAAETAAAIMTGWTVVAILWFWLLPRNRLTYWLLLPLLGLWGSVGLSQGTAGMAIMLLSTAAILMGVWPLSGWRSLVEELTLPFSILLLTLLPIIGLSLLGRFPQASQIDVAYKLVITIFGLLGMLMGLRQTWGQLLYPKRAMTSLAQLQANLAFLVVLWGGPEVALGEIRLLLAVVILYLAVGRLQASWQLTGPLVALVSLIGLPLTAGFAGRASLYSAWGENGRFLLILVLTLLHVPLVTAGFWLLRRQTEELPPSPIEIAAWSLPAIGLISFAGLRDTSILIWLAVLLPFVLGLIAMRWVTDLPEVRTVLRRAFMFSWTRFWPRQLPGFLATNVGTALHEAARILEGESGLLWLLAFVVILLLVR